MQLTNGNPVLTLQEVAELLHVTPQHLYNLSSEKKLPFRKLKTRKFLVSVVELAEYLDRAGDVDPTEQKIKKPLQDWVRTKKIGRPRKS